MTETPTNLLAVLIDADNVPNKYAEDIFQEIAKLGEASVRRVYGDASKGLNGWDSKEVALGLVAHHQRANTTGKNASDIALVIDAMDLMHSGRFHGFVLVSSDSDFTRLAQRLREQGYDVFGMGEKKTPKAFVAACKRFTYVENINPGPETGKAAKSAGYDLDEAKRRVQGALEQVADDDGWAGLGGVGSQLGNAYPDWDPRTYGHKRLSDLVRAIGAFEIETSNNAQRIRLKRKGSG